MTPKTVTVTVEVSEQDYRDMIEGLRQDGTPLRGRPLVGVQRLVSTTAQDEYREMSAEDWREVEADHALDEDRLDDRD